MVEAIESSNEKQKWFGSKSRRKRKFLRVSRRRILASFNVVTSRGSKEAIARDKGATEKRTTRPIHLRWDQASKPKLIIKLVVLQVRNLECENNKTKTLLYNLAD